MNIIGISGLAGDGKDSVCNILSIYFNSLGSDFYRFAFADRLKAECRDALIDLFSIDPLACSREEKEIIRDYLVFYAKIKRIHSKGQHWVKSLSKELEGYRKKNPSSNLIVCIPDVRHAEFKNDELGWIRKNHGVLIHVKKFSFDNSFKQNKIYTTPINNEEAKNTPILESQADFVIEWQNCSPEPPEDNFDCVKAVYSVADAIMSQWGFENVSISSKNARKPKKIND